MSTITFEDRPSESPLVELIWRSRCERPGPFISMALSRWQLVVWRMLGATYFTVRGPETRATPAYCPAHEEYVGILLAPGAYMPLLGAGDLVDVALTLPAATSRAFRLDGSAWEYPDYENADTFVARLVRRGLLVREPLVDAAFEGRSPALSSRTTERRFLRATGMTRGAVRQIERARYATTLLRRGVAIVDAVALAGYFDQPHLTRSLKRFVGQTPAQLGVKAEGEQLSVLYKTPPAWCAHNGVVR